MARRKNAEPQENPPKATVPEVDATRVLLLAPVRAQREMVLARVAELGLHAAGACDVATAVALLHESVYDVVLITESGCGAQECIPALLGAQRSLGCIVLSAEPTFELATAVMRSGGVDLLALDGLRHDLACSIEAACRRSRLGQAKDQRDRRRTGKLRLACRELHRSRHELMSQLGTVCNGMATSYRDLTEQMRQVAMAAELNAILRQELELESLLRTTLEYTLKKVGPTNAAVFLPATSGDFSLGAYVNYDCPKDSAETLLDHLTDIIAPAFEHREDIAVMRGLGELKGQSGCDWLEDSTVAAFSCLQDGECLGVVVLFRDRRNPFSGPTLQSLKIIRDLFGKQLSRVIKTHHRHLPKNQWGGFGDAGGDDVDLAA